MILFLDLLWMRAAVPARYRCVGGGGRGVTIKAQCYTIHVRVCCEEKQLCAYSGIAILCHLQHCLILCQLDMYAFG